MKVLWKTNMSSKIKSKLAQVRNEICFLHWIFMALPQCFSFIFHWATVMILFFLVPLEWFAPLLMASNSSTQSIHKSLATYFPCPINWILLITLRKAPSWALLCSLYWFIIPLAKDPCLFLLWCILYVLHKAWTPRPS